MSVSRPARCLLCSFSRLSRPSPARRKFHSSPSQLARKPPVPNSNPAPKPDLVNLKRSRHYSPEDQEALKKIYTPQQLAAIEASESFITKDEIQKTPMRTDPWSPDYYEDLSSIHPNIDKPVRQPWSHHETTPRLKSSEELDAEIARFVQRFPTDPSKQDQAWEDFESNMRITVGNDDAELRARTAESPGIGKLSQGEEEPKKKSKKLPGGREEEAASPALVRLMQMTGYDRRQIAGLRVKSVISHRVVNQTRLGKISKRYYLSIAGNGQGLIGIGEGKSEDPDEARLQSQYRAIRNMQPILRYENRTIYGDVKGKVSATELELYARPPGFGLRCQQYIWEICRCAGISDLAARVTRSRNPMNTVKATVEALLSQKDPEDIARARGKKLVDVRKVYYAGMV